jgi:DNA uptake protein ComE-like DNA-binding protein
MKKIYYQRMAGLAIVLACLLAVKNIAGKENADFSTVKFISESGNSPTLSEFNPNSLDAEGWKNLGFSDKQSSTILKYKEIVGGEFTSKEQIKKCYVISDEKFRELEPLMLFSNNTLKTSFANYNPESSGKLRIPGKFNPDKLSQSDWQKMGYSEKQASAILKYKNYLGGSFVSKEKLRECFIISNGDWQQMEASVLLREKTPEDFKKYSKESSFVKSKTVQSAFDPNVLDQKGWMNLGFSEKQAAVIVNYRDKNLRGSFKTLDDIKSCFVISPEKFEELKPFIRLNESTINKNVAEKKLEIKNAQTDFSKTDLNTITFKQLMEFGLDERSAGSIIGFRKKLGGFMNKNQILDTYNIDKDLVQKLLAIAPLDNSKVERHSLKTAPEEWLKNHPYFKYSADKIIFYRVNNPDDEKILKLLKQKPEYETRMRLYMK